jgi:hypothetical protein
MACVLILFEINIKFNIPGENIGILDFENRFGSEKYGH